MSGFGPARAPRLPAGTLAVGLFVLWEIGGHVLAGALGSRAAAFLPTPGETLAAAVELLADGTLIMDAAHSLVRVTAGVAIAVAVGVPVGLAAALGGAPGAGVEAVLRFLRPIPPVAWIPLTLLWLGVSERQQVAIVALGALFPVVFATLDGVRAVPTALVRAARNLGAGRRSLARRVLLPAALPHVAHGVREAVGMGWFAIVAAELVAAPDGLGVLVLEGRSLIAPERTFVGMAAIAALYVATDALIGKAEEVLLPWEER